MFLVDDRGFGLVVVLADVPGVIPIVVVVISLAAASGTGTTGLFYSMPGEWSQLARVAVSFFALRLRRVVVPLQADGTVVAGVMHATGDFLGTFKLLGSLLQLRVVTFPKPEAERHDDWWSSGVAGCLPTERRFVFVVEVTRSIPSKETPICLSSACIP